MLIETVFYLIPFKIVDKSNQNLTCVYDYAYIYCIDIYLY